jgi:Rhodopirellula transposase DDE domain
MHIQHHAHRCRFTEGWLAAEKQRHWPGTSKWNKIEHRLFSQITRNWRGRPLTSHEAIINLIGATTTTTGLTVTAQLDTAPYPTGVKVSDREMKDLPITRDPWHGEWNYTLHPAPDTPEPH